MLWDVATQRILKSFEYRVRFAELNQDGSQILLNFGHSSKKPPLLLDCKSGKILETYHRMVYAKFANAKGEVKLSERRVEEKMLGTDGKLSFFRGKYNDPAGYLIGEDRGADYRVKFNGAIKAVTFSLDNSLALIAADNKMQFYQYDGKFSENHNFPYEGYLTSMAISPNNELLLLSYLDNKTHHKYELRAVNTGEILFTFTNTQFVHPDFPPIFSPDSRFIYLPEFVAKTDENRESYRMVKINCTSQERLLETETFLDNCSIYLSADGKNILVGNMIFDAENGQKKTELNYDLREVGYFDINETGNLWAINNFSSTLIFDKDKQAFQLEKTGYWNPTKLGFEEYGYYNAANCGMRGNSLLGEEIGGLIKKEVDAEKLAEAQRLVEREMKRMEEMAEKQGGYGTATAIEFFGPDSPMSKLDWSLFQKAQQGKISMAAYSPNGKYIAAISDLGRVYLLEAKTKKILQIIPFFSNSQESLYDEMCQILFSHDSNTLVFENGDAEKIVYSIPKKDTIFTVDLGNWMDAILHPQKEEILIANSENVVQIIDLKSREIQFQTQLDDEIRAYKYCKNGGEVMVLTQKKDICIYDVKTGGLVESGKVEIDGNPKFASGKTNQEFAFYQTRKTYIEIFQGNQHLYDFYSMTENDWVAISPNGHFDGTERGLEKLYFSNGVKTKSLAEFPDSLRLKGLINLKKDELPKAKFKLSEYF
jgi:WD40 repeat protein